MMRAATQPKPRSRAEASRERRTARAAERMEAAPARATSSQSGPRPAARAPRLKPMPGARARWDRALPWAQVSLSLPEAPALHWHWRMASGLIVLLLGFLVFALQREPQFFVGAIDLAGAQFVPGAEIYEASNVDSQQIFWLDPKQIQRRIEQVQGIESAAVEIGWPNQVNVTVVERRPALLWQQGGEARWVDNYGVVFPSRAEVQDLLPIMVDDTPDPLAEGQTIPTAAIQGALQLRQLRPNIELLHYDAQNGLSYQDGRGWRGYFGVGADMQVKLAVYETLVDSLLKRDIHPQIVNVANPDVPYYRK